ncbi:MAG: hypothetical protein DA408_08095 [Bacteroidetes bacterium]|nr:MAG: hypothetical protein C7N36_05765 [Bacteroidota bacterium]PTM13031.1 MAG: hypothetical protein DA408_08095 [Bacteroidota bacterium]
MVWVLGGVACPLHAQSASDLKSKREQLLAEIKANTRRLTNTRRDQAATLEQLALLQQQIRNREQLIVTLQQEIGQTDANILRTTEVVGALSEDVTRLGNEYSHLMRAAYRARLQNSWLKFLLSSRSFNEAFRRWQYLRQYQRFRSRQAKLIVATQHTLQDKLGQLNKRRQEKEDLLRTQQNQKQAIGREKSTQDQLLGRLKASESTILTEMKRQEAAKEELNRSIENAIAAEMARMRREERTTRTTTTTTTTTAAASPSTASSTAPASGNFSALRGRLPWPVNGPIVKHFGRQPHPTVKGVEISNNGIDINVTGNTAVKSVADGVVVSTHFVPGYRNMILVRHGDYYTVYSNLETIRVSSGNPLTAGQDIGEMGSQGGALHFEVWRQKERLNPEQWIGK